MRVAPPDWRRTGIAAPLALVVLVAMALLSTLFVDAALGELRAGSASLATARVGLTAEGALAEGLAVLLDSAVVARPPGALLFTQQAPGADSVVTTGRIIQSGVAEIRVTAISRRGGFRVLAGRVAFATIAPDSLHAGAFGLRPLPAQWWVATP